MQVEMCRMMLYEISSTDEAEEVPSKKPDNWRSQCSEILMQKVSLLRIPIEIVAFPGL